MTKKPRIIDNNEGNERGCRPDRPNRPKKNRSDVRCWKGVIYH